jgi:4-hydroxybutyrate CoA-transferase
VNVSKRTGAVTSRIVSRFPEGTRITTPSSEVQYVVTEYGCVNLKPLSMKDRVRAMISLAHPDFRDQLREEAVARGLL